MSAQNSQSAHSAPENRGDQGPNDHVIVQASDGRSSAPDPDNVHASDHNNDSDDNRSNCSSSNSGSGTAATWEPYGWMTYEEMVPRRAGATNGGFDMPDPEYDLVAARARVEKYSYPPLDVPEESIEEEVNRAITEVEEIDGPLSEDRKARIANKIRTIREGAWLRLMKVQVATTGFVPMAAFDRLVAQQEATMAKTAAMLAQAEARIAKRIADMSEHLSVNGRVKQLTLEAKDLREENESMKHMEEYLTASLRQSQQRERDLQEENQRLKGQVAKDSKSQAEDNAALKNCQDRVADLQRQLDAANRDLAAARVAGSRQDSELQVLQQQRAEEIQREQVLEDEVRTLRKDREDLRGILGLAMKMVEDL